LGENVQKNRHSNGGRRSKTKGKENLAKERKENLVGRPQGGTITGKRKETSGEDLEGKRPAKQQIAKKKMGEIRNQKGRGEPG